LKAPTVKAQSVKPVTTPPVKSNVTSLDLDKLAFAVSMAETGGCKDGTAIKRNNCFGIMQWNKAGVRSPKYYKTQADSFADFKKIWSKHYKIFPNTHLAAKWTGNDNPVTWLKNVTHYYNQ